MPGGCVFGQELTGIGGAACGTFFRLIIAHQVIGFPVGIIPSEMLINKIDHPAAGSNRPVVEKHLAFLPHGAGRGHGDLNILSVDGWDLMRFKEIGMNEWNAINILHAEELIRVEVFTIK